MKGIIDIHSHMFPEDVINNWDKYANRDYYISLLTNPHKGTIQRYARGEEAIDLADKAGVEKIVMQGWYWNDHELCKYHNDYMYELVSKYPGRFEAFMSINPNFGEKALEEVERNYRRGFAGIGELGPGGNSFDLLDFNFLSLMELANEYQLPVNIHCSEPVGRVYPGKDKTSLAGFYELAKSFPQLTIILAHLGGGLAFYESIPEIRASFSNVYYDLAAHPLVYSTRTIRQVVDLIGPEKLLFGSDFPLLLYPSKSKDKGFQLFIDDIRENAQLNREEWQLIMGDNSRKILDQARDKTLA